MLSPDDILRRQRRISILSGNLKICSGLAVVAALVCVGGTVYSVIAGESFLTALMLSVVLIFTNLRTRKCCQEKLRALKSDLDGAGEHPRLSIS